MVARYHAIAMTADHTPPITQALGLAAQALFLSSPNPRVGCVITAPDGRVLVEGFKSVHIPKIEIHRPAHGRPLLYPDNPAVVAVATDAAPDAIPGLALPRLDLNDPAAVADFILRHQGLT